MIVCPRCGTENPERARFCLECGNPLEQGTAGQREGRRTVTVVFCDVTGSTTLGEHLDPESLRQVMGRYFDTMSAVLARHGGTVEKLIGDAVLAVFGLPELHEDDALRAVRAALEMGAALGGLNTELDSAWGARLQVRTGVHTGEVVVADPTAGQGVLSGAAVKAASALEQAAEPGQIVLSAGTLRLVRDAVEVDPLPAGPGVPDGAVRLLSVVPGAAGHQRRLDAPLVGREQELRLVDWAFQRVLRERTCHLFTVLGPAGVGKSRFVAAATGRMAAEATVLHGDCPSYGESITFRPVAEVVRQALGIPDGATRDAVLPKLVEAVDDADDALLVAEGVAQVIGLGEGAAPMEETSWAVRRFLESLARTRPLVVVFDDIQWAESTFLDLVDHVADWTRNAPILLLCIARPELLDTRPSWGGGKLNATSLLLEPLTEPEAALLVDNLLDAGRLDPEVLQRITEAAEGNPLFVEEMLGMLLDDDVLRREGDVWVPAVELEEVTVPPTIQALLAARLDRLDDIDARVLERASVAGKLFERAAVEELSPTEQRDAVSDSLRRLARKDLIRPERSTLPGGEAFQFRHLLIRDAAYDSLPKQERAELHERLAAWLDGTAADRTFETDEVVAFHLEQAYRYRVELGLVDEAVLDLGRRATARLAGVGRRALARDDMAAAATLLGRAAAIGDPDDPERPALLQDLGHAVMGTGELVRADEILAEAAGLPAAAGDARLQAHLLLSRLQVKLHTDPSAAVEEAEREVEQVIAMFEELGDDRGLARAWSVLGGVHWTCSRVDASQEATSRAVTHARAAGDEAEAAVNLGTLVGIALFGPTPVEEGVRLAEDLLSRVRDRSRLQARALRGLGGMRAMQGRFDEGRRLVHQAIGIFEDLGGILWIAGAYQVLGVVEWLADDLPASEVACRRSYEGLTALGDRSYMSTAAAMLAHVVLDLDRYDEAEELTIVSEQAAAPQDVDSQITWRTARARVLAARGEAAEAERLGLEALELGRTTELAMYVDALVTVGELLAGAGDDRGVAFLEDALARYEAKGNVVLAGRVRARLAELGAPVS